MKKQDDKIDEYVEEGLGPADGKTDGKNDAELSGGTEEGGGGSGCEPAEANPEAWDGIEEKTEAEPAENAAADAPEHEGNEEEEDDELSAKEIMLSIRTVQESKDSEPETIDLISEGYLYKKKGATYLCYDESELSGIADNRVILKVMDDRSVQMNRFGEFSTELLFEKRKRQTSVYSTPFGEFRVEILTDRVDIDLREKTGNIYIEYTVSISGTPELKNRLSISYE